MLLTKLAACGLIMLFALSLGGCLHDPLPYSPNYSRITLLEESIEYGKSGTFYKTHHAPPVAARKVHRTRTVDVPDACITPDVAKQPLYLPPGCANNLNLQMMVERPGDLAQGRHSGPATAAPAVRAAQRYLYGGTEAERRAARVEPAQEQPAAPTPFPQGLRPDAQ